MDNQESLEIAKSPVFGTDSRKLEFSHASAYISKAETAQPRKLAFWKVASVGIGVGLSAGAVLVSSGVADYLVPVAIPLSMLSLIAAGFATGNFFHFKEKKAAYIMPQGLTPPQQPVETLAKSHNSQIITVVYEGLSEEHTSDTYERDKVLSTAKQALLSMDHTKTTPH